MAVMSFVRSQDTRADSNAHVRGSGAVFAAHMYYCACKHASTPMQSANITAANSHLRAVPSREGDSPMSELASQDNAMSTMQSQNCALAQKCCITLPVMFTAQKRCQSGDNLRSATWLGQPTTVNEAAWRSHNVPYGKVD